MLKHNAFCERVTAKSEQEFGQQEHVDTLENGE